VTLAQLNALEQARFIAMLAPVFEHSPWVAQRAWKRRPFASVEELFQALADAIRRAGVDEQLALIRAHPEIAGKEASGGRPAADSTGELGRLGFLSLDRSHVERMAELNRRYRQRFGFPCVVALKLHAGRASVMADMQRRLGNTVQAEMATALEQIGHIARSRLDKIVEEK
jgi:2-oxo-4-hydroxy-4-carboxy-5-ureidoimidazoline decarboxylase